MGIVTMLDGDGTHAQAAIVSQEGSQEKVGNLLLLGKKRKVWATAADKRRQMRKQMATSQPGRVMVAVDQIPMQQAGV